MKSLIEQLLEEQGSVNPARSAGPANGSTGLLPVLGAAKEKTAVELFSDQHDQGLPSNSSRYNQLMPASAPAEGQQYAFEVDLDRCSGCKACVSACHSMNGLDPTETFRSVGLLTGGTATNPIMQHVTTACHHCLEPGCMKACPVDAYEKDPVTGIVKHLDDQCFGCQYCTLACPYDVPQYNASKGIVRKCDMCSDRLAEGEAPACVQACPHSAISIEVIDVQQAIEDAETDDFLPAAPDPLYTLPTTRFKTKRVFPRNTLPADYYSVSPQTPHWPLVVMLVLTQLSVGAFVTGAIIDGWTDVDSLPEFRKLHATMALILGLMALGASTMHLGRPQYAFRAFIGIRHSWLSREIIAFGGFAGSAFVFAAACWFIPDHPLVSVMEKTVGVMGGIGVFSSVMIYVVTGREFWSFGLTAAKFALTSAVLGIAATWASIMLFGILVDSPGSQTLSETVGPPLIHGLIGFATVKLLLEASLFRYLLSRRNSPLKRTARLLVGPLSSSVVARFACGILGGIVMPWFVLSEVTSESAASGLLAIPVSMLVASCFAGEILERYQFFAACSAPRMPGGLRTPG